MLVFYISLGCQTTSGCSLGGSALGSRKETCLESGKRAAQEIIEAVSAKACVDQYIQVLIQYLFFFMLHYLFKYIVSRINLLYSWY